MLYSKGSLLVTQSRISHQVINRLRPASDADILVPGGTVSIIGTTSVEMDSLTDIRPTMAEVSAIIREGAVMVPELAVTRYIRAYAGVRPLVKNGRDAGRTVSRNYTLKNHESDGLKNFVTITSSPAGPLTCPCHSAAKGPGQNRAKPPGHELPDLSPPGLPPETP
jgi:glycerol-3-phosphate dehydrogenase